MGAVEGLSEAAWRQRRRRATAWVRHKTTYRGSGMAVVYARARLKVDALVSWWQI